MDKIKGYRSRLAALTLDEAEAPDISPGEALVVSRSLADRLRKLKKEILAHVFTLRARARDRTRRSLGPKPSLRELWERREEGARELLDDVKERVTGLLDDEDADAVEAAAEIGREIDQRLDRLRELQQRLARALGHDPMAASAPPGRARPDADRADSRDDDLYAAVGAAVQEKGTSGGAFCTQCGQAVEADDRFCRRCGHRLR